MLKKRTSATPDAPLVDDDTDVPVASRPRASDLGFETNRRFYASIDVSGPSMGAIRSRSLLSSDPELAPPLAEFVNPLLDHYLSDVAVEDCAVGFCLMAALLLSPRLLPVSDADGHPALDSHHRPRSEVVKPSLADAFADLMLTNALGDRVTSPPGPSALAQRN